VVVGGVLSTVSLSSLVSRFLLTSFLVLALGELVAELVFEDSGVFSFPLFLPLDLTLELESVLKLALEVLVFGVFLFEVSLEFLEIFSVSVSFTVESSIFFPVL